MVGVVRDVIYEDLRSAPGPIVFIPVQQHVSRLDRVGSGLTYEVKTSGDPYALAPAIRDVVRSIDSKLPVTNVRTQEQQIHDKLDTERTFASLTAGLGLLVLILAGLGLYGVMSYNVTRRTKEIGIQMALGADAKIVLGRIMRETILIVGIGIVIGVAASYEANRVVANSLIGFFSDQRMLFGVGPSDPFSIALAALFLVGVAAIAGYLPARRAAKVDPLIALRSE
ncbi:MAG TPA: FtsX-like permease family protein [Blastocatellia bacterium]|nr:FtsX-like permease family protein [Blastocatellia bacterium]